MKPTIATVRALFGISKTHFAPTLYDPRDTSLVSRDYHNLMEQYFSDPDVMKCIQDRLIMSQHLNNSQIKAVAGALYAVDPSWCGKSPHGVVGAPKHKVDATSEIYRRRGGLNVPIPDIYIIEGPPGTGKTHTVSTFILNLIHYLGPDSRILLCGPSNTAVDEVLLRVLKHRKLLNNEPFTVPTKTSTFAAKTELLRVGMRDKVSKDVLNHRPFLFLDDIISEINKENESKGISATVYFPSGRTRSRYNTSIRSEVIGSCPVIFTTLGSIHQLQRLNILFDVVIVDEVSQATEPTILPALMSATGKCILVGDWKQLQPTVLHPNSARCGLKYSLMERLLRNGFSSQLLCIQYRMHPTICAFPNRYFYQGKLQTDLSVLQRQSEGRVSTHKETREDGQRQEMEPVLLSLRKKTIALKLATITRLAFVDVPNGVMKRRRGNSWHNTREAEALLRFMRQIRSYLGLTIEEFAEHACIVTYYTSQRDTIIQSLAFEERRSGIQVATVDSFQGKEKDIILVSCVRADVNPNASKRGVRGRFQNESVNAQRVQASESRSPTDVCAEAFSDELGFLRNWHRINVSLTRAKELCIVFGHRKTLETTARKDMQVTENSAVPRAVSVGKCGETGVMMGNPSQRKVIENITDMDENPFILSDFIQHVVQHDCNSINKTETNTGGACEQASCKNSVVCISSDSSVEQETKNKVRSIKGGVSACQTAYITYKNNMMFLPYLQKQQP
ncbi:unnamed protein product [Phytomonas sp. Hart1]|nr:unnamed protein product [Phytomonas sp. Hart1]|eukprot:CCW66716.1 unnamed protein product [Phytomonas sp. isolate Hart1]